MRIPRIKSTIWRTRAEWKNTPQMFGDEKKKPLIHSRPSERQHEGRQRLPDAQTHPDDVYGWVQLRACAQNVIPKTRVPTGEPPHSTRLDNRGRKTYFCIILDVRSAPLLRSPWRKCLRVCLARLLSPPHAASRTYPRRSKPQRNTHDLCFSSRISSRDEKSSGRI